MKQENVMTIVENDKQLEQLLVMHDGLPVIAYDRERVLLFAKFFGVAGGFATKEDMLSYTKAVLKNNAEFVNSWLCEDKQAVTRVSYAFEREVGYVLMANGENGVSERPANTVELVLRKYPPKKSALYKTVTHDNGYGFYISSISLR